MVAWLTRHATALGVVIAALGLGWAVYTFYAAPPDGPDKPDVTASGDAQVQTGDGTQVRTGDDSPVTVGTGTGGGDD